MVDTIMINSTKEWDWMDNNDLNKDGTFMDVQQEERLNLSLMIQLIVGISIASACAISILVLGILVLSSKLGI